MDTWNRMIAIEIWKDVVGHRIYIKGRADQYFSINWLWTNEKEDLVTVKTENVYNRL